MNERIRIQFIRDGLDLPVSHLGEDGLTFAFESSARPLGFGIGLAPANSIVAGAMATVRRNEDWTPDVFKLKVTREDDSLIVSGGGKKHPAESLRPGQYQFRFFARETKFENESTRIYIPKDGEVAIRLQAANTRHRFAMADRATWDSEILAVCGHSNSRIDGMDPLGWLGQPQPRLARKACLLNLLSKVRSLPSGRTGESICGDIESIRWADVDRIAVTAGPGMLPKLQSLAGWRDSGPIHPSHVQNLARLFGGKPEDYRLESFREPLAMSSLQVVCATHKATGRVFAEIDVDLGNPAAGPIGLLFHIGELADPGRTNHVDLFEILAAGTGSDFLYYKLEQAHPA